MANIISTSTYNFLFSELKLKNNILHVINHFVPGKEKKTIYPGSRLVCNKDKNSNVHYITYIPARGDF